MVSVFKTSVNTKNQIEKVSPVLNKLVNGDWNFDLEDCDNILRIDSDADIIPQLIFELKKEGIECEELMD